MKTFISAFLLLLFVVPACGTAAGQEPATHATQTAAAPDLPEWTGTTLDDPWMDGKFRAVAACLGAQKVWPQDNVEITVLRDLPACPKATEVSCGPDAWADLGEDMLYIRASKQHDGPTFTHIAAHELMQTAVDAELKCVE